eukprot:4797481-Lingulodinium_polyedra.AAC.1
MEATRVQRCTMDRLGLQESPVGPSGSNGPQWRQMEADGIQWTIVEPSRAQPYGLQWVPVDSRGFQWNP